MPAALARLFGAAIAAALMLPAVAPAAALADSPGYHPYYVHALHDLRYARALLGHRDERNVVAKERSAIVEIDQAIGEITRAAISDRKDLDDRVDTDVNLSHRDRLQKALALLYAAQRDLNHREDNWYARGWRDRAYNEVTEAISFTRGAIHTDRRDDGR